MLRHSFNRFTPLDIGEAIKDLNSGKSSGMDMLYGKYFKYAHNKVNVLLALVFNCMVIYGFVPDIMNTLLVQLVKDTKDNLSLRDNYRPLAITCIASKIL